MPSLALKFDTATGAPFMMPYAHLVNAVVMHELKMMWKRPRIFHEVWKICNTYSCLPGRIYDSFVGGTDCL